MLLIVFIWLKPHRKVKMLQNALFWLKIGYHRLNLRAKIKQARRVSAQCHLPFWRATSTILSPVASSSQSLLLLHRRPHLLPNSSFPSLSASSSITSLPPAPSGTRCPNAPAGADLLPDCDAH